MVVLGNVAFTAFVGASAGASEQIDQAHGGNPPPVETPGDMGWLEGSAKQQWSILLCVTFR